MSKGYWRSEGERLQTFIQIDERIGAQHQHNTAPHTGCRNRCARILLTGAGAAYLGRGGGSAGWARLLLQGGHRGGGMDPAGHVHLER